MVGLLGHIPQLSVGLDEGFKGSIIEVKGDIQELNSLQVSFCSDLQSLLLVHGKEFLLDPLSFLASTFNNMQSIIPVEAIELLGLDLLHPVQQVEAYQLSHLCTIKSSHGYIKLRAVLLHPNTILTSQQRPSGMEDDLNLIFCYHGDSLGIVDGPHQQVPVNAGVEGLNVTLNKAQLLLVPQSHEPSDHLICGPPLADHGAFPHPGGDAFQYLLGDSTNLGLAWVDEPTVQPVGEGCLVVLHSNKSLVKPHSIYSVIYLKLPGNVSCLLVYLL